VCVVANDIGVIDGNQARRCDFVLKPSAPATGAEGSVCGNAVVHPEGTELEKL